jgi:uncharacterized protein YfaP (DUF2135 family)
MADDVIVLTGIKETLDALKEFDKDAVKRFNKVINTELAGAQRDAKGLIDEDPPMSGWRRTDAAKGRTRGGAGWPGWNAGEIKSKITKTRAEGKVRKGDFTTSAGALLNKSAAGAIFEVAGRRASGTKKMFAQTSSGQFLRTLENRFKKASRVVWRVVDKDKARIQANVAKALNDAEKQLQRELNRERA